MKPAIKKYLLGLSILGCLVMGVFLAKPITSWLYPTTSSTSVHSLYVARDINEYSKQANAIIIGEVREVSDPYTVEGGVISQQNVTINVQEVLKGDPTMTDIRLLIRGEYTAHKSERDRVSFVAEEEKNIYKPGEKILLFVGKTTWNEYVPFAGPYGKYLIDENNNVSSIGDFQMPLEELKTEIQKNLKSLPKEEETQSQAPTFLSVFNDFYPERNITVFTQEAMAIVIGEVTMMGDPYLPEGERFAYQDIGIDVKEVLKGDPAMTNIKVVIEGGHVVVKSANGDINFLPKEDVRNFKFKEGDMSYIMEGEKENFKLGEKTLLFITKNKTGHSVVFAGPYGKYLIDENNNVSSIGDFRGDFRIPLAELKTQIQEALKISQLKNT
jgi:hypothetical protein